MNGVDLFQDALLLCIRDQHRLFYGSLLAKVLSGFSVK